MTTMGCVEIYENWLTEETAKGIIDLAEKIDKEPLVPHRFEQAGIGKNQENGGDIRSNRLMPIANIANTHQGSGEFRTALQNGKQDLYLDLANANQLLGEKLVEAVNVYTKKYEFEIHFDEGLTLLKYESGQYYKPHCDYAPHNPRYLSALILLNPTEYEGGGTHFVHFDEEVKPDTPSLVLFPSNYAYSHTALPVDSGTKYALVTWLGHGIDFDGMPPMYLPNGENKYAETRFQGDF